MAISGLAGTDGQAAVEETHGPAQQVASYLPAEPA